MESFNVLFRTLVGQTSLSIDLSGILHRSGPGRMPVPLSPGMFYERPRNRLLTVRWESKKARRNLLTFPVKLSTRPMRRVVQAVCFHAGVRALSSFEDPRLAPLE